MREWKKMIEALAGAQNVAAAGPAL
jgi:hypothetical protein